MLYCLYMEIIKNALIDIAEKLVNFFMELGTYPIPNKTSDKSKILAHRGAWDTIVYKENTLRAFKHAQELEAWGVELDVHFTKDDIPVVSHDPDLKRILGSNLIIRENVWETLHAQATELPLLEEVLNLKDLHFMIEIKNQPTVKQQKILSEVLNHLIPEKNYHLITLNPNFVFTAKNIPSEGWILIGEFNLQKLTDICIERNLGGVAGQYLLLNKKILKKLKAHNKKVGTAYVTSKNIFYRECGRQVDWVFTNSLKKLMLDLAS